MIALRGFDYKFYSSPVTQPCQARRARFMHASPIGPVTSYVQGISAARPGLNSACGRQESRSDARPLVADANSLKWRSFGEILEIAMSMADRDGFIWYDGKLVP